MKKLHFFENLGLRRCLFLHFYLYIALGLVRVLYPFESSFAKGGRWTTIAPNGQNS